MRQAPAAVWLRQRPRRQTESVRNGISYRKRSATPRPSPLSMLACHQPSPRLRPQCPIVRRLSQRRGPIRHLRTKRLRVPTARAGPRPVRLARARTRVPTQASLNVVGADLAQDSAVHAITDVTGFGLLGHALEMARGAGQSATLRLADLPLLRHAEISLKLASRLVPPAGIGPAIAKPSNPPCHHQKCARPRLRP